MIRPPCVGCVSIHRISRNLFTLDSVVINTGQTWRKHHVATQIFSADRPNYDKFPSLKCAQISLWLNPTGHSKFHNTSNTLRLLTTPFGLLVLFCTRQYRRSHPTPSPLLPLSFFPVLDKGRYLCQRQTVCSECVR